MFHQGMINESKEESRRAATLLFFIGMFSLTQINIGGKLGISEFVMVACAPFVFLKNIALFRRDGNLNYFYLNLLWIVGAVIADLYSHTFFPYALKGWATPITLFADSVCVYVLLRKNLNNLKYLLLGIAISGVISIFVFQRGGAGDIAAESGLMAGAEKVMAYKLFWSNQITTWLTLPICGWYLKCKKSYCICVIGFLVVFNLFTGARSAMLAMTITFMFLAVGGKTQESIRGLKRHALLLITVLAIVGLGVKVVYQYAVKNGYMGEEELRKYEMQTRTEGGESVLSMLMSGRAEFFICLFAAVDNPIIGLGSFPIDNDGYTMEFLSKYGTPQDYERVKNAEIENGARIIPWHSHIATYWLWHGVLGLIFWIYVFLLVGKTLFLRMHAYPPWFGYLSMTLPLFAWDILFSPLGLRVNIAALLVSMLIVSKMSMEKYQVMNWR